MRQLKLLLLSAFLTFACTAHADEGMWTFDNPPTQLIQQKYGVSITPQWLDRVRLATVRLSNCTASFVSPNGLILTNTIARGPASPSTRRRTRACDRRLPRAETREKEVRCQTQVADVLQSQGRRHREESTAATKGMSDKAANDARKETLTQLERPARSEPQGREDRPLKCERVKLYQGGQYWLYKYKRYDDVRLVFAPEDAHRGVRRRPGQLPVPALVPRHVGAARLRERQAGRARRTTCTIDFAGPAAGEPVFVSGHPGSTDRLLTRRAARRAAQRLSAAVAAARLGAARPLHPVRQAEPAERAHHHGPARTASRTRIKVRRKKLDALHEDALLAAQGATRKLDSAKVAATPSWPRASAIRGRDIEKARRRERALSTAVHVHRGRRRLQQPARSATRARSCAARRSVPSRTTSACASITDTRVAAHRAAARRAPCRSIRSSSSSRSRSGLERMREWLGPDDPMRAQAARRRSRPTRSRKRLSPKRSSPTRRCAWRCGRAAQAAIAASNDPMIVLARCVDPRRARRPQAVRRRGRSAVRARRRRRSRRRASPRSARSVYPGRDVHAAPELRHGAGLERERHAGASRSRTLSRAVRARHRRGSVPRPGQLAAR